jgi:hypothetical protein
MVKVTPEMINVLIQCKMMDDEDSYAELISKFADKHVIELKLEAFRDFLNHGKKVPIIYDGNREV